MRVDRVRVRRKPFPQSRFHTIGHGGDQGRFIQCPAVDRYHFDADGLMEDGETLYDFLDATQRGGVLPRDDSRQFRALMAASKLPALLARFGNSG